MSYESVERTLWGAHNESISVEHFINEDGKPKGGTAEGLGMKILFQNGPIGWNGRNGAFVEDLIMVVISRLEWYNSGEFRCRENSLAITKLEEALMWLDKRTADRRERGVEGTYQV